MPEHLTESDEQLDLKKRARRRLIGAAVFASTAAVILPMVMDRDPPPAMPNIELRIPSQEKTPSVPLAPVVKQQGAPAPAVPTVAEPVAPVPPTVKPEVQPEPKAAPVAEPKPVKQELKPEAKLVAKPEPKVVKPESKPEKKAEPRAEPAAEAKRAQAILEGKEAPAGDAAHVVLIGAFKEPGNVEVLKKKIGEMGIRVYTENWDSPQGKRIRVRAGPFPTRDTAEKAAARIKSIGVSGVVAPKS